MLMRGEEESTEGESERSSKEVLAACRWLARFSGSCGMRGGRPRSSSSGVLGVELIVVFGLVSKGYGVCSVWVHGW